LPHLDLIILVSKLFAKSNKPHEAQSDLKEIPSWLNALFFNLGRFENWLLNHGISLPVGSSLFVVAKKGEKAKVKS